jgi:Anti-sigma-D factor RsdA to sigma factor binding region
MADRHESDGRESPESPQTGRSGELHSKTSGATSTERDDTQVSPENEYFSALDLDEDVVDDLALVRADDELLDALAAQANRDDADADFDDEQLNALLLAWRQDVDSVPVPEIVDTKTAVATLTAARSARRRRPRLLVPVAAAAAVLAVAFAGVGMAARGAEPGDALWGLSKVLYADHARSVEAANSVRSDLSQAQQAIEQGQIDQAKDALEAAGTALSSVSSEDGQDVLKAEHQELLEQLTSPPTSTTPTERSETPLVPSQSPSTSTTPPASPPSQPSSTPPSDPPSTSSTTGPQPSGTVGEDPGDETPPRSDTPGLPGNGPVNTISNATDDPPPGDGETQTETSGN